MKWISVQKNLPDLHGSVLVTNGVEVWEAYRENHFINCVSRYWTNGTEEWENHEVTHYMEYPEPPTKE